MNSRRSCVLNAALIAMLLGGCTGHDERADLVFLNGAEPQTLDPALITGQPEGRIASSLFEGLMAFSETGEPVPGVAESWEISSDRRVYTFHLRSDAKWSDGTPVTAVDFVDSWRRTLAPETGSEYVAQLYYLDNAVAYNKGALKDFSQVGVRATDQRTLVVSLTNPTPFFLDLCAFTTLLPVPVRTITKYGDDWIKPQHIVTNGAYVLKNWRINDHIRLAKNPHYWNREHVAMRTVDVYPAGRPTTAFNFYVTGLADLIMDKGLAPSTLMDELKKRPDFHSAPFLGTYFIRFNVSKKPFDDPRVRHALSLVIDKEVLVRKITKAGELPAQNLVPPGTAGYESPAGPKQDVEKARRLLAEAGYPEGRGFPLVSYLYKGDSELDRSLAVELQAMWQRELGVTISPRGQEWQVYLSSLSQLDYEIARSTWVGDYKDPNTFLDMFVTNGGNNRTGWSNAAYDKLIADAAAAVSPEERYAIFRRAEELLISRDAPICPLYFYVGIQFYDSGRLGGITANLLDEHPLRTMFWKDRR